jgi:phage baseplate assembly protein W|tara:strand:+ start:114 stop:533 length:420 start_codon:yes stop_codon:yes gene_type:complete
VALKTITSKNLKVSRSFQDLANSFAKNPVTKDLVVLKNQNAIKQAMKNLVLTSPGEKLFQSEVGSKVYQLLFEPLDAFTVDTLQDEITNTLRNFEPRVEVISVEITALDDYHELRVDVEYRIVGQPLVQTIDFILQRAE